MFRRFNIQVSALCVLVMFIFSVNAADIIVSVDRSPVVKNESFKLLFNALESPDDDPDFSPLNEQLEVLNQRKNTKSSWVNGESNKRITWVLDVMAKQAGELTIPPINFGDDVTSALAINVVENDTTTSTPEMEELFLDVKATPNDAYVQSQVLYTVRLYQRVRIGQATLTEPAVENAIVEKLGEDKQFNTQINGVNYSVFERMYAIFPQQSGVLTIPPMELTAQVLSDSPRSRFGSVFNQQSSQAKRIRSEGVDVNVRAIPASFTAEHWLAAENIHLQQTWSNDDLKVTVGEPLTRTLTVLAEGVSSSQLPDLVTEQSSGSLKMYPDQPMLRDQKKADGVVALREQKVAIIPSKAGQFEIPAIRIPWLNTQTHQMETAILPAVTITAVNPESEGITHVEPQAEVDSNLPTTNAKDTKYWMWTSIALAIGWMATLIWIAVQRTKPQQLTQDKTVSTAPKVLLNRLREACSKNNPKDAMNAFLNWAELQHGTRQLSELKAFVNDELLAEITDLNAALYANKKQVWNGARLIQLVEENVSLKTTTDKEAGALQALHKI